MIQREQLQIMSGFIHEIYKNISDEKRYLDVSLFIETETGNIIIDVTLNKPLNDNVTNCKHYLTYDSNEEDIRKNIDLLSLCKDAVFYSTRTDSRKGFEEVQKRKLKELQEKIIELF